MNIGIILAGGIGSRMGIVDKPKQFLDVYGKPILVHTLESFDSHPEIDFIAVVCADEWSDEVRILIRKYELNKIRWIIKSGDTRQKSVYNAINTIKNELNNEDIVVIHDAVRPLVSHRIISENIKGAIKHEAVDTVIPTADTIINSKDEETIFDIPLRKELYLGQTPQSFKLATIKEAHFFAMNNNISDATDDCQLVLKMNKKVYLVNGDKLNFKITSSEDLLLLKSILKMSRMESIQS